MSSKFWMMGGGAVLGLVIAVVMIIPDSRRHVLGTVRGEPVQNEKYMSEWITQLSDPDLDKRTDAAANLGSIDHRARPALPELLRVMREDEESKVRGAAAFAVYKIASDVKRQGGAHATEIYDTVIVAMDDPDPLTRMNAALALGMLEGDARKALPVLEKLIRKKENKIKVLTFPLTIREQMIAVIGFMGEDGKDGLKLLKELLLDPEETTRTRCAMTLGKLGPAAKDKETVEMLIEAIGDAAESETVQNTALEALKLIDPEAAATLANK